MTEQKKLSETEEKVIDAVLNLANALEAAAVDVKHRLSEIIGVKEKPQEQKPWNPDKVKWTEAQGSSGLYERSEDVNSLDFKEMLKDLAAHSGKLSRDGYFYWSFQNGSTVGRKKRKQA